MIRPAAFALICAASLVSGGCFEDNSRSTQPLVLKNIARIMQDDTVGRRFTLWVKDGGHYRPMTLVLDNPAHLYFDTDQNFVDIYEVGDNIPSSISATSADIHVASPDRLEGGSILGNLGETFITPTERPPKAIR